MPIIGQCAETYSPHSSMAGALRWQCDDCGDWVQMSDCTTVGNDEICASCLENYTRCHGCRDYYPDDDIYRPDCSQYAWCRDCRDDRFGFCEHCDSEYRLDDGCSCGGGDDDDKASEHSLVHDYGYRPKPVFWGGPKITKYGVELEVTCQYSDVDSIHSAITGRYECHAYLKADSSVDGVEIVTHPHTLAAHRELWRAYFRNVALDASDNGMHVHIQRKWTSPLTFEKIAHFIGDPGNADLVTRIAERDSQHWAKRIHCPIGHHAEGRARICRTGGTRYEAVNFANTHTVEVRIFRGVDTYADMMRNLEFIDALRRYCIDASIAALTTDAFCDWVRKHRKEYAALASALASWKFIESPKKPAPAPAPAPATNKKEYRHARQLARKNAALAALAEFNQTNGDETVCA